MTDITKYNGERCILDQIELHIEDKDKIGILGVNGTGKSTLLKIISGIEDYQGKMTYQKDLRINYLPQTPLYNEMDTIMETVYKQIDSKDIHDFEIKAQLGKFGIYDENQKIKDILADIFKNQKNQLEIPHKNKNPHKNKLFVSCTKVLLFLF